jgi:regulator of protease activity HflC (stomatin/prohibitin superfamily)
MWYLSDPQEPSALIVAILILSGIKILKEYERGVIFRLGRMVSPRGPGIIYLAAHFSLACCPRER